MAALWLGHLLDWLVSITTYLVSAYGLLGLFVASVIANATLFLPLPITFVVFGLGALAAQTNAGLGYVMLVGVSAGLGAAIGELTGYYAGLFGGKALHGFAPHLSRKKMQGLRFNIHHYGSWIIFASAALPFPFDFVGIAAGLAKFDVKKFLAATAVGRVLRDVLVALAGFYGLELIKHFFL